MAKGQKPPNSIPMFGRVFGRLTVIAEGAFDAKWKRLWVCACSCGERVTVRGESLRNRNTQSCGCLNDEKRLLRNTKHGHSCRGAKTETYKTWRAMIRRCHDHGFKTFDKYGGRGIKVCVRWHTFANFLADMGERPKRLTIDRIDGTKGYSPDNCRWATWREQRLNQARCA
jgi:hypothetical protein